MLKEFLLLLKYCTNHMIVNVGIKSNPGKISSTKLNTPPKIPFLPPNILIKIRAEIGAQITSKNSPRNGIL